MMPRSPGAMPCGPSPPAKLWPRFCNWLHYFVSWRKGKCCRVDTVVLARRLVRLIKKVTKMAAADCAGDLDALHAVTVIRREHHAAGPGIVKTRPATVDALVVKFRTRIKQHIATCRTDVLASFIIMQQRAAAWQLCTFLTQNAILFRCQLF